MHKGILQPYSRSSILLFCLLFCLVFMLSMLTIYNKHEQRKLFANIQRIQSELLDLKVERSRLLLEKGTLTANSRIDLLAKQQLGMHSPTNKEVRVLSEKET